MFCWGALYPCYTTYNNKGERCMCEPVMRRTTFDARARQGMSALSLRSPLAKALSLFGALSLLTAASVPVQAETVPASVYSIISPKAQQGLLLDVVLAGNRLVAVGDRGHILFSDDNGVSWTQAKVPSRQDRWSSSSCPAREPSRSRGVPRRESRSTK